MKYIDINDFFEEQEAKLELELDALEEIDMIIKEIPGFVIDSD